LAGQVVNIDVRALPNAGVSAAFNTFCLMRRPVSGRLFYCPLAGFWRAVFFRPRRGAAVDFLARRRARKKPTDLHRLIVARPHVYGGTIEAEVRRRV